MQRPATPGAMKLPAGAKDRERFDALEARVKALEAMLQSKDSAPKPIEDMKAGELVAYAEANGLDIGGLVAQSGKEKILAALKEAIAKKDQA